MTCEHLTTVPVGRALVVTYWRLWEGFPLPVPIYKLEGASIALCAVEFFPVFPKLSFKLILDKRNTN